MRLAIIVIAIVVGGCAGHSPTLVWEGGGAPRATRVETAVSTLRSVAPGVRSGVWGDSPDATFQLLDAQVAESPHVHERHDLTVVLIAGEGRLVVEDREYVLREGDVVHVERGRVHHFHPKKSVLGLVIFSPRLEGIDYQAR